MFFESKVLMNKHENLNCLKAVRDVLNSVAVFAPTSLIIGKDDSATTERKKQSC